MKAQISITLAVAGISILVSSGILTAQFLTGYDISHEALPPGQHTITVKQTGLSSANNAIMQIITNDTISNYAYKCIEGEVQQLVDNGTLVVEFSRMSPGRECNIELEVPAPVNLEMDVNSDGRITRWTTETTWQSQLLDMLLQWLESWPSWALVILLLSLFVSLSAVLLASQFILPMLIIYMLQRTEGFNNRMVKFSHTEHKLFSWIIKLLPKNNFKKSNNAEKIKKFVSKEYGLKINEIDATILELVYLQKTTIVQLEIYSGLALEHVKYRIRKMRRIKLVSKEKMELHETLDDFFSRMRQIDAYG